MKHALFMILALAAAGCGVKAPPIAPEHPPQKLEKKLNCSPQDPTCDEEDPNYRPRK